VSRGDDRFASLAKSAAKRCPRGSFRLLWFASATGRAMRTDRTFAPIGPGGRSLGVEIDKKMRQRILDELGLSTKTWQNAAIGWVDRRLAHRCRRGVLFVFIEPQDGLAATCPACLSPLAGQVSPGSRDKLSPLTGHSRVAIAATTSENIEDPGGCYRVEEGVDTVPDLSTPEASKRFQKQLQERSLEIAALARLKDTLDAKEEEVAQ
jgi:hypothetical protein